MTTIIVSGIETAQKIQNCEDTTSRESSGATEKKAEMLNIVLKSRHQLLGVESFRNTP